MYIVTKSSFFLVLLFLVVHIVYTMYYRSRNKGM